MVMTEYTERKKMSSDRICMTTDCSVHAGVSIDWLPNHSAFRDENCQKHRGGNRLHRDMLKPERRPVEDGAVSSFPHW